MSYSGAMFCFYTRSRQRPNSYVTNMMQVSALRVPGDAVPGLASLSSNLETPPETCSQAESALAKMLALNSGRSR